MKKAFRHIHYLFLLVIIFTGCSTAKNTWFSRNMQALSTEYNVVFNANQSYEEGLNIIEKAHTDDYSKLIPLYPISVHSNASVATPQMERTIEKVQKAIKIHSIRKKPKKDLERLKEPKYAEFLKREEYNYRIDEGWILLGKAQFHKTDFLAAVGTFTYTINHFGWDKDCVSEARIWLAKSYIEMGWLYDAEDVLTKANKDQVPSKLSGVYSAASSDLLLKNGKYTEAIPLLIIAAKEEKNKNQRNRFNYIIAQLYRLENNEILAKQYFSKVIRANPPSEMEFNARISRAEAETEKPNEAIQFLRKMLKNSKYDGHQEMIYFTIGNIYQKMEKYDEAIENYKLALEKSNNNIVNKVQILIALADLYYFQSNYIEAQPYYNEASTIMPLDNSEYERIRARSELLDKLNQQNEIVILQDSLQRLSKLSDEEKKIAVEKLIKQLQENELALKEKLLAETAAENNAFLSGDLGVSGMGQPFGFKGGGDWYFYNNMLIASGRSDFQRKWGTRKLEDNWRRKNKSAFGETDYTQKSPDSELQTSSELDKGADDYIGRSIVNTDVNFYLKQIPVTEAQIAASNEQIADALYTMGMMYKEDIEDIAKAELTFDELERRFPLDKRLADVYYNMYQMSMKANDSISSEQYKNRIIQKFPKSSYAIMFSMPDYAERMAQLKFKEDSIYQATYFAYLKDDFETVFDNFELIKEEYPLSELIPKFTFLNALARGKSRETDLFIESLQTIITEYPQSDVSTMAKDILALTNQGLIAQAGGSHNSILSRRDSMCLCQNQDVDTLTFQTDLKEKHLLIIVAPKNISLNQLQFDVAIYNFTGFMITDFDLEIKKYLTSNLFIISSFDGYNEAMWYKEGLYKDSNVRDFMLLNDGYFVVVSISNFELLKKGRSIDEYLQFYKSNIDQNNPQNIENKKNNIAATNVAVGITETNDSVAVIDINKFDAVTVKPALTKTTPVTITTTKKDTVSAAVETTKKPDVVKPAPKPLEKEPKPIETKQIIKEETKPIEKTPIKEEPKPIKKELEAKPEKPIVKEIKVAIPDKKAPKETVKPITVAPVIKKDLTVSIKPKEPKQTPVSYVYKSLETHSFGIIVLDGSFGFKEIKAAFDSHNATNYPMANYKVTLQNIGSQKIILISNFPTANAAKTYLFRTNRFRELFEELKDAEFRKIIISESNLNRLIQSENITNYLEFNQNSNMK